MLIGRQLPYLERNQAENTVLGSHTCGGGAVTLITQLELHPSGSWHWKVFESPSQNPELNPFENLWNNLKTDRHRCSSSSLSKLQHICILGWGGGRDCVLHSWCCIQFQEQRMEITSNHCFQHCFSKYVSITYRNGQNSNIPIKKKQKIDNYFRNWLVSCSW